MAQVTILKDLKQGDFFKRKESAKKVFIREHFNRKDANGPASIWCSEAESICDGMELKPTTVVFVDFEY